jgi:hypothetical protein
MTLQEQLEKAYQDRLDTDAELEKAVDHQSKLIEQWAQANAEIKRLQKLIKGEKV